MTKINLIPSVILIFIFNCCLAQNSKPDPVTITKYRTETGEQLSIESRILNEKKEIHIGLPDTYNDSTNYPIVVVLEGEILFETFAPLTKLMGQVNEIPECIVVGIPFYNKHLEYAPNITGHPESGNANKMLEFYREELFPILDSLYHCTEDRIIWAHSGLGGIFCTYLLLGPDSQFSGILSSSPNLKWMQEYITAENAFESLSRKGRVFYYLTFGSDEGEAYMGNMYQQVHEFMDKLAAEAPGNLVWKFQLYENNNHFTNAVETYMDGLILYFKLMQQE